MGYIVQQQGGRRASRYASRRNADINMTSLMDVMMPGLSGGDACMQIREFSDVPIIMLTARSEDSD